MFSWFKNRRRRKLLAEPFPGEWHDFLSDNVYHYKQLSDDQQAKLRDNTRIIAAEKSWEGCEGLDVTEEMKITIAAQASLLLLGHDPGYYFDGVHSVLIFPDVITRSGRQQSGLIVDEREHEMLGEAWQGGPIVLSWPDVLDGGRNAGDGRNLVLHEFAHHLDGLDGEMGGAPPMPNRADQQRWYRVTEREFQRLVDAAEQRKATLLDSYGASNKAEFFAVSTECFFERPRDMRKRHPDLYEILHDFYRQDPAARKA